MLVRVADETVAGNPTGFSNLSFVAPLAVTEAATQALGATPLRVAGRMCFRALVAELRRPLRFCNRYVSDGTVAPFDGVVSNTVALAAGNDAASALSLFDAFKGTPVHIREVSARVRMTRGQHQAYLRSVRLPSRVRAGRRVRVRMVVKVVRGERRRISFRWRVPRSLRPGRHRLTFRGTEPDAPDDVFDDITIVFGNDDGAGGEGPRSLKRLARAFRRLRRYDGIRLKPSRRRVYRDPRLRIGGTARARVVVRR
jgi:hypothetical protein